MEHTLIPLAAAQITALGSKPSKPLHFPYSPSAAGYTLTWEEAALCHAWEPADHVVQLLPEQPFP